MSPVNISARPYCLPDSSRMLQLDMPKVKLDLMDFPQIGV